MNNNHWKIRRARIEDLPSIVMLLSNDPLGCERECYQHPLPTRYSDAFHRIDKDDNHFLMVVEDEDRIVGTLQLTVLQYLTYQGGRRAQIEAVRVATDARGKGVGAYMVAWAIQQAKTMGCHLVQLTTDKKRPDALAFYRTMGFEDSHEGLKYNIPLESNA